MATKTQAAIEVAKKIYASELIRKEVRRLAKDPKVQEATKNAASKVVAAAKERASARPSPLKSGKK
ncbi:hypothetical protein M3668_06180 [Rothia sp. P100]|uniref:hypothetical protein n=1 Tax=Rothia sp. P100 TaxID=2939578 RepID=UPI00203EAED4|nr:hypothetical protein [Rothia sp. P100]MCM3510363.1 hypothetical protein [Rothia sp. P100]